jgi:dienelactone hydrolase
MSTKILDYRSDPNLQPAQALWKMVDPDSAAYRFQASTLEEALAWQAKIRPLLDEIIGFQEIPWVFPEPELIEQVDRGDFIRQKIRLKTTENTSMPVYLLLPKDKPKPFPVILAFHGHGYGVKDIVGVWEDGQERFTPEGYQKDFAVDLCRKGFAVAAPEISCFGERRTDFSQLNTAIGSPIPDTCEHTARLAFHLGGSVVGLRVLDGKRLVDYLETLSELDMSRVGAMGISGGGMHTFFSTCLDTRIKACVISGYFSAFRDSLFGMHHCACNFVPGLAKFGEIFDLAGLIAPRPMLIEAGSYDPIFPIASVGKSIQKTRQVYQVFGAENEIQADFFEGRHQINGRLAYEFLASYLLRG